MIGKHLYKYSTNCLKRNSPKLLFNNWNQKNDLLLNRSNEESINKINNIRGLIIVRLNGSSAEHKANHSKLWTIERYLSIGLLAVIPVSFMTSMPAMNYLLALSLVTHIHWGIEAIVADYIRPNIFGKLIPKIALTTVYLLSMLSLGGLFYFNYTDVGLIQAIRMIAKM